MENDKARSQVTGKDGRRAQHNDPSTAFDAKTQEEDDDDEEGDLQYYSN